MPRCWYLLSMETSEKLKKSAEIAVKDILKAKKGEKALIITNPEPDVFNISQALYNALADVGALPVIVVQPVKTQFDYSEPSVVAAIKTEPEIILSISKNKLGKDKEAMEHPYMLDGKEVNSTYHYLMETRKSRSFWSPSITEDMFIRTVPIDYNQLKANCARLKFLMDKAVRMQITAPGGTDLSVGLSGRKTFQDDGDFSEAGAGGNVPAGEVFISPQLGTSCGTIVFDGSISVKSGDIVINHPIKATVENGFVTSLNTSESPEAAILAETIEEGAKAPNPEYAKNARNLGEIGIGLNPAARITGNMLEDEKAFHTCHIAIGHNYDEDAPALIHLDGLVRNPTIELFFEDGSSKVILRKGILEV